MLLGSEITWVNMFYSSVVPSFGGKHIQVKMVGNILA